MIRRQPRQRGLRSLVCFLMLLCSGNALAINFWTQGTSGDANGNPIESDWNALPYAKFVTWEQTAIDFCKSYPSLYEDPARDCQVVSISVTDGGSTWNGQFELTTGTNGDSDFFIRGLKSETCSPGETEGANPWECYPNNCAVDGLTFYKQGAGSAPASFCEQGCNFVSDGANIAMSGGWMGFYTAQGSCSPNESGINTDLNCLQTASGTQYCADTTATGNCGTVNGEYVCLDSVPDGNCLLTPMGQAICDAGSQTASPTETIDLNDATDAVDVYPSGSTGGPVGGNGNTTGTNDTDGDGSPGAAGEGGGECPAWENCSETHSGTTPDIPDDGCDFNCITTAFYTDLNTGPWGTAVNAVSLSGGGASCPAPTFSIFETSFTMDAHCNLGETVRTLLSVVFLGIWGFAATRVVLSA